MDPHRATELLTRWAVEAGFDRAGVARVEPSARRAAYLRWLAAGEHGAMGYLARRVEERLDPRRLVPGAKSVLCVALRYWPLAGEPEPEGDLWPRVARYARGEDYHGLMEGRLRELEARIDETFPGAARRRYVDTGPVLERELAARAGLGAVGKNTCLLHRDGGSYFFLGELFLALDLEPAEPLADMCGSCTLCLEACPTGALPEPFHLDASRCISTWTIEQRGWLPVAAREMAGDWVFGCDVCQEVCPWNRRRQLPAEHPELGLSQPRRELDLATLLGIRRDEYVERFRRSPMKRAGQEGLQRNAAVAMGNRRDPAYVPPLASALANDSSPVVRGHAAWALGRVGGEEAAATLEAALDNEEDPRVREEIEAALGARSPEPGPVVGQP